MKLGLAGLPADDLRWIVESAQHNVEALDDCTFLVTGASGFIGRWIVASLVEMRHQLQISGLSVSILVRDPESAMRRLGLQLWNHVEPFQADINSPWTSPRPITHVIHGATPSSVRSGSGDRRGVLVTSVAGTERLIRAVGQPRKPPRLLHLSSGAVYGPQSREAGKILETWVGGPSPLLPSSTYAEGKRAAEALLEDAGREGLLRPIQARLFALMGPGLPTTEGFAIGNFIRQATLGERIYVHGNGATVRSYLNARAMALWLILLSIYGSPGTPYNVGSPYGHTLRYWAELCASLSGVDVFMGDQELGDRPAYVPDIANSRSIGIDLASDDSTSALTSWMTWIKHSVEEST